MEFARKNWILYMLHELPPSLLGGSLFFDNGTASISEVTVNPADLSIGNDWSVGAPEAISLWV